MRHCSPRVRALCVDEEGGGAKGFRAVLGGDVDQQHVSDRCVGDVFDPYDLRDRRARKLPCFTNSRVKRCSERSIARVG